MASIPHGRGRVLYRWRQLGRGPRSIKLPNGDVRIRVCDLEEWLRDLEDNAA